MTLEPPSEDLRRRVWNEMIAADMRTQYFARMASRSRAIEQSVGGAAAVFSSATLAVVLGWIEIAPILPAAPAAILAAVAGAQKFGKASMKLTEYSVAWGKLHARLEDTWTELESGRIDHDDVRAALAHVQEHQRCIDRQTTAEPVREKVLLECLDRAEQLALAR